MDNNIQNNVQGGGNGQNSQNSPMDGNWQPQPQWQMMPPQKQPMDPAKKKKLILGISLGVGGVVLAVIAVVAVLMLTKADYGESYRLAKELKPKISDIKNNYDCSSVVKYASSTYTNEATYNGYIDGCAVIADGVDGLVTKLGQSSGVKKDKELRAQFERFQEAIDAVLPDEGELKQRLEVYKAFHKFIVASDGLNASKSSDAEIQNAAKALTESGNEILAKYGEGWLEKSLAYTKAYREYYNSSYSDSNRSNLRAIANEKQTELKNWIAENKPDIAEVGGLSFENSSKMYTEFTKLYDMIVELYEENYDGSGDCTEFLGEVYCS